MKVLCIMLIALVGFSSASSFNSKVNDMMMANAQASDAVDTVQALLEELKDSIYSEQADHDARWAQQQVDGNRLIAELTQIADMNRAIAEQATERREWVENEIADSHAHLEWIARRLDDIHNTLVQLNVSRCQANQLFVMQLKEHQDALDAIDILRTELARSEAAGEAPVFAQVQGEFTSKLAEYEHMFEAQAVNEFFQQDMQSQGVTIRMDTQTEEDIAYVDETSSGRVETDHTDNEVGALDTESFESTVDTSDLVGNIYQKVAAMLDRLQKSLEEGAATLEENEIQAALDVAEYQIKAAAEVVTLHQDADKREAYLEKLAVDLEVALIVEADAWQLSYDSDEAVAQAKRDLQALRDFYNQETDRRNSELADLDWVIDLFMEQVATLGATLRDRIDDYVHDERFDSMFHREGDANVEAGVWGL